MERHVSTVGRDSGSASDERAEAAAIGVHVRSTATGEYFQTPEKLLTRRGVLWLGQTCNIRCHFCYFLDRIENKDHPEHPFMDLEKAKQICHTLRYKYGNTSIDIQGGEPTIWRHIEELITYCHEIGLYPTLITNAITLARREKCEQLRQAGVHDLLISVQGLGPVYDEIVGLPGGSVKQAKGLDNCIEVGIPFRFNCVLSLKAVPQYVDIAKLAVEKGALAVNFLAFNPFEDQATGHRSTFNVPSYSQVAGELNKALDVLAEGGVEANVRYFPICMVEERHRKSIYNFPQLSYDPHEWDYDSWSWTGQQPQRMKWGDPSQPHESLAAVTYNSWVFNKPENGNRNGPAELTGFKGSVSQALAPFPGTLQNVKKVYWSVLDVARKGRHLVRANGNGSDPGLRVPDELNRNAGVYRDHAIVRAQDHCRYQYAAQCNECDVKAICDGFHGDYATLFTSDEARPIHLGTKITDPTYYIRHQVKIYEPEEASRPFRHKEPLAGNGAQDGGSADAR
jgi:sulfatase maturation enzyme AslB (radical SAM superfamily)